MRNCQLMCDWVWEYVFLPPVPRSGRKQKPLAAWCLFSICKAEAKGWWAKPSVLPLLNNAYVTDTWHNVYSGHAYRPFWKTLVLFSTVGAGYILLDKFLFYLTHVNFNQTMYSIDIKLNISKMANVIFSNFISHFMIYK